MNCGNNYTSSSTSGNQVAAKSTRFYGVPGQKSGHCTPTQNQEPARPHKIQVLKPIINYKCNAQKVIGIDMSQDEYSFYQPILAFKKVGSRSGDSTPTLPISELSKIGETGPNGSGINQENSAPYFKEPIQNRLSMNPPSAYLVSPKSTASLFSNQRPFENIQSPTQQFHAQKLTQIQNYSSNSSPMSQRNCMKDDNQRHAFADMTQQFQSNNDSLKENIQFLATSKVKSVLDGRTSNPTSPMNYKNNENYAANENSTSQIEVPDSTVKIFQHKMLAYENTKQQHNNPLQDISNRVANYINTKVKTPPNEAVQAKVHNQFSLPFQIAPQQNIKINNYLDQPFKQITTSLKQAQEKQQSNIYQQQLSESSMLSRHTKNVMKFSNNDEPSSKPHQHANKYFATKRRSDNTLLNDERLKIQEQFTSSENISENQDQMRSTNNCSVATSKTSGTDSSLSTTSRISGQQSNAQTAQARKQSTFKSMSKQQKENLVSVQKILKQQDLALSGMIDQIRRRQQLSFHLNDVIQEFKDLAKTLQDNINDPSLILLMKQHQRTHYLALAFIKCLENDLKAGVNSQKTTDNMQAIILNAIDYIKKNIGCFYDILELQSQCQGGQFSQKNNSKKDLANAPFGLLPNGSRNGNNKENLGGNAQTTTHKRSKSEKKQFIRQNISIAIAFLKKICRTSTAHLEQYKEFNRILTSIETGSQMKKVKDQITKITRQIRNSQKRQINNTDQLKQSKTPITQIVKKVNLKIEVEEEVQPFAFAATERNTEASKDAETSGNRQDLFKITVENVEESKSDPEKELFLNKENFLQPMDNRPPGRVSLQPKPLVGLKCGPVTPKSEVLDTLISESDYKENVGVIQPQISIVTKSHQKRIQNTHEPVTVRGARPHHRLEVDENNVQQVMAPPHICNRSSSLPSREPYLPAAISKNLEYTLVLDLDETLIHFDAKIKNYRVRPGAIKFLSEMSKYYELVIFTAGLKDYADLIINDFDKQSYIQHRLYRDHTKFRNGVYVKDLSKLGRDLNKTIIIDNISENFSAQPDNGIPIRSFYHDANDRELEKMIPFLRNLVYKKVPDVKTEVRQYKALINYSGFIDRMHKQMQPSPTVNAIKANDPQVLQQQVQQQQMQQTQSPQAWGDEQEANSDQEESPPHKKKQPIKKKTEVDEDEEEEEEDEEEESERASNKKKQVAKKKQDSEEEEEEVDEEEEEEEEEDDDKAAQKTNQNNKSKQEQVKATESHNIKEMQELRQRVKELEGQELLLSHDLLEKEKDITKLSTKLLEQDHETSKLRRDLSERDSQKETLLHKIKELEAQLVSKNTVIAKQQEEISEHNKSQSSVDFLKKSLHKKEEEVSILKARLHLDLMSVTFKIVPEYPDLVDETRQLQLAIKDKDAKIVYLNSQSEQIREDMYQMMQESEQKEKHTKELQKEKDALSKSDKQNQQLVKQCQELQKVHEQQIKQLEESLQKKTEESEQRLDNLGKLIQKNEQLTQQMRVLRQRVEKFKNEQITAFQKELTDKTSEIEVLKEMIKGNQLQLKAKDREVIRFKQRMIQYEGSQIGQGIGGIPPLLPKNQASMNNSSAAILPPTHSMSNHKSHSYLKNTPSKIMSTSKLSSVNSTSNYFPNIDPKSTAHADHANNGHSFNQRMNSKDSKNRMVPSQQHKRSNDQQVMKVSLQKKIVEDTEGENSQSINPQTEDYQQLRNHPQVPSLKQKALSQNAVVGHGEKRNDYIYHQENNEATDDYQAAQQQQDQTHTHSNNKHLSQQLNGQHSQQQHRHQAHQNNSQSNSQNLQLQGTEDDQQDQQQQMILQIEGDEEEEAEGETAAFEQDGEEHQIN